MTDKQIQRTKDEIKKIKAFLAAEKRKFGGYFDNRALRYVPTSLYVKIGDFAGGLRYLSWFRKNFPGDIGFPNFLFESTIIFFENGKIKEAEKSALRTYCSNALVIDILLHPVNQNSHEDKRFYRKEDVPLTFIVWLEAFVNSQGFINAMQKYNSLKEQLDLEPVGPRRSLLVEKLSRFEDGEAL
ncbi:MAG TPA: hypothetical protein VD884_20310 [Ohtaekwangia sp.]|nr:hypothetical protein [Ohtaekwangia sp.]